MPVNAPPTTEADFVDYTPPTHAGRALPGGTSASEDFRVRGCEEAKVRHKQWLADRDVEFDRYRSAFQHLEGVCVICAAVDGDLNGPDHPYKDCPLVSKSLVLWANTVRGGLDLSKVDACYVCMLSSLGNDRFHTDFSGSVGGSATERGCVLPNFVLGMALLMKMDIAFPWKADFQHIVHRTGWSHVDSLVEWLGRRNKLHSSNGMAMLYAYGGANGWMH